MGCVLESGAGWVECRVDKTTVWLVDSGEVRCGGRGAIDTDPERPTQNSAMLEAYTCHQSQMSHSNDEHECPTLAWQFGW